MREYCKEYKIPDITCEYVHPEVIKKKVVKKVMHELWEEVNSNINIPWTKRKTTLENPQYDQEAKIKSKLAVCYQAGSLNLKASRRNEYLTKQGSIECLVPGCCQDDSLAHIQECYGYQEKPIKGGNHNDWYDYLVRLEYERVRLFGARYSMTNFKKVM